VSDKIERLEMVIEVKNYYEVKLFKIYCFDLRGKAKEWYKRIKLAHVD
jgi:hypothetical protein